MYPNIQLIIVDDASEDGSVGRITEIKSSRPETEILLLEKNVGSCAAFNLALAMATGEFVIDLAADDILLPDRIRKGVDAMVNAGAEYGVHFTDAEYIDETDNKLGIHSHTYPHSSIPQGEVYTELVKRYFICPTSLMMRTEMMRALGGYDETLDYEDFDLLIRASRMFKFIYTPDILVQKRIVPNSLSSKQDKLFSRHSRTTYLVCKKILSLNRSRSERRALSKRISYEIFFNLKLLNFDFVVRYLILLVRNAFKTYP
jgi:GT2 family glycosyltransferase